MARWMVILFCLTLATVIIVALLADVFVSAGTADTVRPDDDQ